MHRLRRPAWLGTLRRTTPLSDFWGLERGTPVDRYYIEHFLESNRVDVRGSVLEIRDSGYTDRYGTAVEERCVLDVDPSNAGATFVADLAKAEAIPSERFDCFLLVQTLQYVFDLPAALAHASRILRPEGVLLLTVPGLARIHPGRVGEDLWRFTVASTSTLLAQAFSSENVAIRSYGNVLTGIAALAGMAHEELSRRELEVQDEGFPVIVAARAVKPPRGP